MADFDIYDDLDELHAKAEETAAEEKQWKEKYQTALGTIEKLQIEKKELSKKVKQLETNFSSLLATARAEIKRKDNVIAELRREKDDICFRRNVRPVKSHEREAGENNTHVVGYGKSQATDQYSGPSTSRQGTAQGKELRNRDRSENHENPFKQKENTGSHQKPSRTESSDSNEYKRESKTDSTKLSNNKPDCNRKTDTVHKPPTSDLEKEILRDVKMLKKSTEKSINLEVGPKPEQNLKGKGNEFFEAIFDDILVTDRFEETNELYADLGQPTPMVKEGTTPADAQGVESVDVTMNVFDELFGPSPDCSSAPLVEAKKVKESHTLPNERDEEEANITISDSKTEKIVALFRDHSVEHSTTVFCDSVDDPAAGATIKHNTEQWKKHHVENRKSNDTRSSKSQSRSRNRSRDQERLRVEPQRKSSRERKHRDDKSRRKSHRTEEEHRDSQRHHYLSKHRHDSRGHKTRQASSRDRRRDSSKTSHMLQSGTDHRGSYGNEIKSRKVPKKGGKDDDKRTTEENSHITYDDLSEDGMDVGSESKEIERELDTSENMIEMEKLAMEDDAEEQIEINVTSLLIQSSDERKDVSVQKVPPNENETEQIVSKEGERSAAEEDVFLGKSALRSDDKCDEMEIGKGDSKEQKENQTKHVDVVPTEDQIKKAMEQGIQDTLKSDGIEPEDMKSKAESSSQSEALNGKLNDEEPVDEENLYPVRAGKTNITNQADSVVKAVELKGEGALDPNKQDELVTNVKASHDFEQLGKTLASDAEKAIESGTIDALLADNGEVLCKSATVVSTDVMCIGLITRDKLPTNGSSNIELSEEVLKASVAESIDNKATNSLANDKVSDCANEESKVMETTNIKLIETKSLKLNLQNKLVTDSETPINCEQMEMELVNIEPQDEKPLQLNEKDLLADVESIEKVASKNAPSEKEAEAINIDAEHLPAFSQSPPDKDQNLDIQDKHIDGGTEPSDDTEPISTELAIETVLESSAVQPNGKSSDPLNAEANIPQTAGSSSEEEGSKLSALNHVNQDSTHSNDFSSPTKETTLLVPSNQEEKLNSSGRRRKLKIPRKVTECGNTTPARVVTSIGKSDVGCSSSDGDVGSSISPESNKESTEQTPSHKEIIRQNVDQKPSKCVEPENARTQTTPTKPIEYKEKAASPEIVTDAKSSQTKSTTTDKRANSYSPIKRVKSKSEKSLVKETVLPASSVAPSAIISKCDLKMHHKKRILHNSVTSFAISTVIQCFNESSNKPTGGASVSLKQNDTDTDQVSITSGLDTSVDIKIDSKRKYKTKIIQSFMDSDLSPQDQRIDNSTPPSSTLSHKHPKHLTKSDGTKSPRAPSTLKNSLNFTISNDIIDTKIVSNTPKTGKNHEVIHYSDDASSPEATNDAKRRRVDAPEIKNESLSHAHLSVNRKKSQILASYTKDQETTLPRLVLPLQENTHRVVTPDSTESHIPDSHEFPQNKVPSQDVLSKSSPTKETEQSTIYISRKTWTSRTRNKKEVKKRKLTSEPSPVQDIHETTPSKDYDKSQPKMKPNQSSLEKSLRFSPKGTPTHHNIFERDVSPRNQSSTLASLYNINEDGQFQEIDKRMRSLFQSPTYSSDATANELKENLTVDETNSHSERSLCDTSSSSRKVSLGSCDYIIETIGSHTANVFIRRKKCKKKMKIAVATT